MPDIPYPQPPPNMLTQMSNMAALQGQVNQNRLFNQQFGARQAIGQAYQQATDPQTGQTDFNKVMGIASQDPRANYMLGDLAAQQMERQKNQLQIQKDQLDLAITHNKAMNDGISSLLANPKASSADILKFLTDSLKDGRVTLTQAATEAGNIPTDPAQIPGYLQQHLLQNMDAGAKLQAIYGQFQGIGTGGGTQLIGASPMTGAHPLGFVPNTPSPSDLLQTVQVYDPVSKQMKTITKAQMLSGWGNASGGVGGMAAAPPLGAASAAETDAAENAKMGINLQDTAEQVPAQKALLQDMMAEVQKFTPGPTADYSLATRKMAQAFGLPVDDKKIASQEEFIKQAQQIINQQGQTMHAGSDERHEAVTAANLNQQISKLGIQSIGAQLLGNQDAIAAKNQAWQQYKQQAGPESYGQFSSQFNKVLDPRVFQLKYLSPEERKSFIGQFSKTEQDNIRAKANQMAQMGLLGG